MRISDWSSDVCSSDLAVRRGDVPRNRDAVLHYRIADRAAAAERLFAPGDIILIEIVGVEARVEPGDVAFERVRRAELDADIGAVAFAVQFAQCTADQGRDPRVAAPHGACAITHDYKPVTQK